MNLVCLFGILLIATKASGLPEASGGKGALQQRTLLRKLQTFQREDEPNKESVTWNEILADALATKLSINENKNKIASKILSEILVVYKSIYDRFNSKLHPKAAVSIREVKPHLTEDVEIIHPEHKKESCENCDEPRGVIERDAECAEGFVLDKDGDCVPTPSKLILAIPNHCPVGYRADRFGFCRISF